MYFIDSNGFIPFTKNKKTLKDSEEIPFLFETYMETFWVQGQGVGIPVLKHLQK